MENKLLSEIELKKNVVNYLINNKIASSKKEAETMLEEGLWDKIKSGLSNLATSTKQLYNIFSTTVQQLCFCCLDSIFSTCFSNSAQIISFPKFYQKLQFFFDKKISKISFS